jgi:polyhydroxyalkanoate synthesis regulator phasin
MNSKLNTETTEQAKGFDALTEFTPERKQTIITNFAAKHKMTEQQAKDYINNAMAKKGREAIVTQLNKTDEQGNKCY